jgi:hypothetical protein
MTVQLTNRDVVALALAAGIKIGGGTLGQAFAWGLGARILMKYLGFPEEMHLQPPAQNFVQDLSQLWQRVTGAQPQQQVAQDMGNGAQPSYDDSVIDAQYTTVQ